MASTVLVKDVVWRISVQLQDTATQFSRWSERELIHWLNDAAVGIFKYLPAAGARVDAVKLRAGTLQSIESIAAADCKPGDGSTPSAAILGTQVIEALCNMGSDGLTPGAAIRLVDRKVLDATEPAWHAATGAIECYAYNKKTPRYFFVSPGVSGTVWIRLAYNAQPIPITNSATVDSNGAHATGVYSQAQSSTAVINVPDEHTDDLVDYALARAFLKDSKYQDPARAKYHEGRFIASLRAKIMAVTGVAPDIQSLPGADAPTQQ